MNIDTSFMRRRREKQIKFERSMLRELSLQKLKKGVQNHFGSFSSGAGHMLDNAIEEGCYDVAVEAFLLGSRYSRLGYYGSSLETVMERSKNERVNLAKALKEFITYWTQMGPIPVHDESLQVKCEHYVDDWWKEGYTKGVQKYKLRLH